MKSRSLRQRFYSEVVLGVASVVLFGVTLVWNDWIEIVLHIDPDAGNGSLEFLISVALLAAAAVSFWFARAEWRRVVAYQ